MIGTGAVVVELTAAAHLEPAPAGWALAASMLLLGLLLGFLATARQWAWAIFGSLVLFGSQYLSGRIRFPIAPDDSLRTWIFALVPPLALIMGTLVGARFLRRRHQALFKPEHDD